MGKVKTYPASIAGTEAKFIRDFLVNDKNVLKAPAVKHTPQHLKEEIIAKALQLGLPNSDVFVECIYWVYNNLSGYPKLCVSCGNDVKTFHSFAWGYPHIRCSGKCANNDKSVKDKKEQASIERFGTQYPVQAASIKSKARTTFVDGWFEERFNQFAPEYVPVTTREQYSSAKAKFKWRHTCGHEFGENMGRADARPMCPACRTDLNISRGQRDITSVISSIVPNEIIVQNDRRTIYPLELDIFLPGLQLAFEYNGDYWHSYDRPESTEEQYKHFTKYMICKKAGIRLVQIRENFWEKNKLDCIDLIEDILLGREVISDDREVTVSLQYGIDAVYEKHGYSVKNFNAPQFEYILPTGFIHPTDTAVNYFALGARRLWDAGSAVLVKDFVNSV